MHDTGSISDSGTSSHTDSGTSWHSDSGTSGHTGHTSHESPSSPWNSPDQSYLRSAGDLNYYYGNATRGRGGVSVINAVVVMAGILLPIIVLFVTHVL